MKTMKSWTNIAVVAAAIAAGGVSLFGQWPDFPTEGPRTPDGKIDLKGPTPRTADGKIDFSGLWEPAGGGGGRGGPSFNGTPPLQFEIPSTPDDPPLGQFFNVGAGLKDGLPLSRGPRSCGRTGKGTTPRTIRTRSACLWDYRSCTCTSSRERSSRRGGKS